MIREHACRGLLTILPRWFELGCFFMFFAVSVLCAGYIWKSRPAQRKKKRDATQVLLDIRELNEKIIQLNETNTILLTADAAKEEIISAVLHDLRAPARYLGIIASQLHNNLEKLAAHEIAEYAAAFADSASHINLFIEQLLQWLTNSKESFTASFHHFDIDSMFEDVKKIYSGSAALQHTSIEHEPANISVYSDYNILHLIIRNLTDNAIKHTRSGKVTFSAEQYENEIVIRVADTGTGISREMADYLMNSASDPPQNTPGAGLGFKLIKKFVLLIHAGLYVGYGRERGTIFTLSLPVDFTPEPVSYKDK